MSKDDQEIQDQGTGAPADSDGIPMEPETCEKRCKGGGWVTTPFIFGCEASERLAGSGAHANFITFLTQQMHMTNLSAATLMNTFMSLSTVTTLVGAFVSDSYLGRFRTIAIGSCIYLSGMVTLTMIPLSHKLHPPQCRREETATAVGDCEKASGLQMGIIFLALSLMAIGSGGIRPCVAPFGASQFDQSHPDEKQQLKHYFNWYYFTITLASLLAMTIIVYVQDNFGWVLGFGIPTTIFVLSIVFFFGGMHLYRYNPSQGSAFTRMAQVLVAAIQKRNLALPDDPSMLYLSDATRTKFAMRSIDTSKMTQESSNKVHKPFMKQKQHMNCVKLASDHEDLTRKRQGPKHTDVVTISHFKQFNGMGDHKELQKEKTNGTANNLVMTPPLSTMENTNENLDMRVKVSKVYKECSNLEEAQEAIVAGHHDREEGKCNHIMLYQSNQFRFLDKAAIQADQDWHKVVGKNGQIIWKANPWKLCSIQHVEELKCIVRLAPMWATLIPLAMATAQGHTYVIQQANTMDRHLGNHFSVPAASLTTISLITILIWLPFFDKKMVPFLRKYTGKERGITSLQKIGIGIAFQILVELIKALVERKRREVAMHSGLMNNPHATIPISAFWLVPQFVLGGLGESFLMIGHLELFYFVLPEHMTSTGSALVMTSNAIGSSLSTILLHFTQQLTRRPGHPGWLDNNINKAHLDYFYGLLTLWLILNFVFFLLIAYWYNKHSIVTK